MSKTKGGKAEINAIAIDSICVSISFAVEKLQHLTSEYIEKYDLDKEEMLEDNKARIFAARKTSMWLDMEIINDYALELRAECKNLENLLEHGNEKGESADEEEK